MPRQIHCIMHCRHSRSMAFLITPCSGIAWRLHTHILGVILLTCCATCWQVEYAALDALCLLMLLDNMIACAPPQHSTQIAPSLAETNTAQPSEENDNQQASVDAAMPSMPHHKLSPLNGAASARPAAPLQQQIDGHNESESFHDALHTASMSNRCAQTHPGTTNMRDSVDQASDVPNQNPGRITEEGAAADSCGCASGPSAGQTEDQKSAGLQTPHEAAVQQAVEHWACRLEMTPSGKAAKSKAKRHLSRRQRAHIRHAVEQQNQIDDVAGEHHVFICLACLTLVSARPSWLTQKVPHQYLAQSTSFLSFGMRLNPIWLRHMGLWDRCFCTQ